LRTLASPWGAFGAGLLGLALAIVLAVPVTAASKPPPPPPRQVLYDPDPATCKPASLQKGFQQQLLPWADQPAQVQAKLRQVQLELMGATLQRCVSKGLLSLEQEGALRRELTQAQPDGAMASPSGARP
jgi:hypothetical protein